MITAILKGLAIVTVSEYLINFLGTPYSWGGNNAEQGFDCSGLVCEGLRSVGVIGNEDMTAKQIYQFLTETNLGTCQSQPSKDSILFYGRSVESISHIAVGINENQVIEAGGEGRVQNNRGMVRIRQHGHRSDLVAIINLNGRQ